MAWAADLVDRLLDPDAEDRGEAVDDALLRLLSRDERWSASYDLIVASLVSAWRPATVPRSVATECLRRVVERLQECARRDEHGLYWWTPPAEILDEESRSSTVRSGGSGCRARRGRGRRLLGGICGAGVEQATVRPLLEGAVSWLGAFGADRSGPDLPRLGGTSLPAIAGPLRLVLWDPGIAAALMLAARGAGDAGWEQTAVALACRAAERPASRQGRQRQLCHGAAGLAHVYNRMYQATGEPTLGRAALYWLERTLGFYRLAKDAGGLGQETGTRAGGNGGRGPASNWSREPPGSPWSAGCGHIRRAHLGPDVPGLGPRPDPGTPGE